MGVFADNIKKTNNYGRNVYCFRWCRNRCMLPLPLVSLEYHSILPRSRHYTMV